MHILLPGQGQLDGGEEPVDLGQAPADHIILSFADTELSTLGGLVKQRPADAPSVRLANMKLLRHPMSVDLYVENTARHAKTITVRALGGASYWDYGLDRLREAARANDIKLAVLPGCERPDPGLADYSTVHAETGRRLWDYFSEGGPDNMARFLGSLDATIDWGDMPDSAVRIPRCGLYWPDRDAPALADLLAEQGAERPVALFVFYRALVLAGTLKPVDAMIEALRARGLAVVPVYVSSLKAAEDDKFVRSLGADVAPGIVLNTTAFAVSKAGGHHQSTALDSSGAPVIQVVFAGSPEEAWVDNPRGLMPRDLAMNVVLPEIDGRIHSRAVAFKAFDETDPTTGTQNARLEANQSRIDHVAELAASWVRLGGTPAKDRRVGLVFHTYPNKDGRIGNGVGMDTPESAVAILSALAAEGYEVIVPSDSKSLMCDLVAAKNGAGEQLSVADYRAIFDTLPATVREAITDQWGAPETDPTVRDGQFQIPTVPAGNATLMIQPPRGYHVDPKASYHDPELVPTHAYLAAYFWLRHQFGGHAVIHLGKHGTLEWLPGKATALSEECYPEAVFGALPQLYPFIVNDPGEGAQAKRRTSAVVVDHMTPPMARAEAHGVSLRLEVLLDEFAEADSIDPARANSLRDDIVDLAQANGFDRDLGTYQADDPGFLVALDSHLCDLKELQIKDGLHVFGRSPANGARLAHLSALARVPRFGAGDAGASLTRALADDLDLDGFNPMDCEAGETYQGTRPDRLWAIDDAEWRTNGDTIERLELLALDLLENPTRVPADWIKTSSVLGWISEQAAPDLDACGPTEMASLLAGLDGKFVAPGPSGAPTRGRPDVLPTGRNFYAVDVRAVPSPTAWTLGQASAQRLVERYFQDEGEWPKRLALSAWGTSNMRTGGDDIAQAMALIGVKPVWDEASGRVTGFEIIPLAELRRPRIDVTLRISGFFRDAFPQLIDLFDSAIGAVGALDEPEDANPIAAAIQSETAALTAKGADAETANRRARHRIFGAKPGAYGAGLQTLVDESLWTDRSDLARAFLNWGSYAYGSGVDGDRNQALLERRLTDMDAVIQNQDNREHDLLDSDDYYQFQGGLSAAVEHLSGDAPTVYHTDHSRPERPVVRTLDEEIGLIVRGRAANPKWIEGMMRHGYKGAFEIAATVDFLFGYAATTNAVNDHHFDQLYEAYIEDEAVRDFLADANEAALADLSARFAEAIDRGLWSPRRNSAYSTLTELKTRSAPRERFSLELNPNSPQELGEF